MDPKTPASARNQRTAAATSRRRRHLAPPPPPRAAAGRRPSTIGRALTAINVAHVRASLPPPREAADVRDAWGAACGAC